MIKFVGDVRDEQSLAFIGGFGSLVRSATRSFSLHQQLVPLPSDSRFREYDRLLRKAASAFGTPLEDPERYASWFSAADFEKVTERIFKMPTSPWPKDPKLRLVGAFEQENLCVNLDGISMRVFQKGLGWSAEKTCVFLVGVRKDIKNRRIHSYYPYYVIYAQKLVAG